MDLNRYKLDNTYVRAILLLWADGVPWPSGARDRVPGAPTQARFSQLQSLEDATDGAVRTFVVSLRRRMDGRALEVANLVLLEQLLKQRRQELTPTVTVHVSGADARSADDHMVMKRLGNGGSFLVRHSHAHVVSGC